MADSLLDLDNEVVFTTDPDWSSPPSIADSLGREVQQELKGNVTYRGLTLDLNYAPTFGYTNMSKTDEYNLLTFFYLRRGRFQRFWLPVNIQFFTLAEAIVSGASTLKIVDNSAYKTLHLYERVFLKLKNGDLLTRKLLSLDVSPDTFSVASAWDRNIAISDVLYFGRLLLCRFDQDEIELMHESSAVSSCSIKFRELSKEYDLAYGGS